MLISLNKAKKLGVFQNFIWNKNSIQNFETFNVIYGRNYAGKTTFSRIFRCIELGKKHNIDSDAEFEMELSDGSKITHSYYPTHKPIVKVFNSDFIAENLKWDSDSVEPIFLLGEENIELQKTLDYLKHDVAKLNVELNELIIRKRREEDDLNNRKTEKAREIGTLLSIRPFDARHLQGLIEKLQKKFDQYILQPSEFENKRVIFFESEEKPLISELNPKLINIQNLTEEVANILNTHLVSERRLEYLLSNTALSKWVDQGRVLHENQSCCQFCGNKISSEVIEKLNRHFSKDYELLQQKITALIVKIKDHLVNVETLIREADTNFYKENILPFQVCKNKILEEAERYNSHLNTLIKTLVDKKEDPFKEMYLKKENISVEDFNVAINNFNRLAQENNIRTNSFSKQKETALEVLKNHYVATFLVESNHEEKVHSIETLGFEIQDIQNKIGDKENYIHDIESKVSELVKGAEGVNFKLQKFFGKDDIQISVVDNKFKLTRGTNVAKNLSEGEKTAIAFAYFMTSLENNGNHLSETIVYIDDPISSLDANHLFNIYAFIRNTFYKYDAEAEIKHQNLCLQLFISTHNFDLLNLIKDWLKKVKKDHSRFYLIERLRNDESTFKEMPSIIYTHKSEYTYLFHIIKSFHENPADDFEHLYNLPNITRRFIESFVSFKFLTATTLDESIEFLIKDSLECERVRKFVHYHSHSMGPTKMLKFSDLGECASIVQIVLSSLEAIDKDHYESLIKSVSP